MMILALLLSTSLSSPVAAGSMLGAGGPVAAAPSGAREVVLRIEHERLLEQESAESVQDTTEYLRQDGAQALKEQHGVDVVERTGAPEIIVTLHWVRHDDSVYGVSVKTRRPGEAPREVDAFECECIDSGLSRAVLARLPRALEQLEEGREAEPAKSEGSVAEPPAPEVEVGEPDPDGGEDVEPRRGRPLGAMGKVGIGLLAAGGLGLISGGVVFAQHQRLDANEAGGRYRSQVDFEPAGVTAMVVGGAAMVTGAVLLIVDRGRGRRMKDGRASAQLWPSTSGLLLTGRF